jgi:hypothetical protein
MIGHPLRTRRFKGEPGEPLSITSSQSILQNVRLTTRIAHSYADEDTEVHPRTEDVAAELRPEALEQIARDWEVRQEVAEEMRMTDHPRRLDMNPPTAAEAKAAAIQTRRFKEEPGGAAQSGKQGRLSRVRKMIEVGKSHKTTKLLLQIWQSDYSIVGFILVMATFYVMKDVHSGPVGVLFFLLAMAEIDAILSIFVVRLSFHQNKHGFYRTEDFERDWLRYRMLLSMTKAALIFVVVTSSGPAAGIGSYIMWFFTSTLRFRYIILRWSMDDHYPDLQRWSIFALLREAGIEPKLKNFNLMAALGIVLGFGIAFLFPWTP